MYLCSRAPACAPVKAISIYLQATLETTYLINALVQILRTVEFTMNTAATILYFLKYIFIMKIFI